MTIEQGEVLEKGGKPPWLDGDDKDDKKKDKDKDKDMDKGQDAAAKSETEVDLTEEQLVKSLENLDAIAEEAPAARKDVLLVKAQSEELSDDEKIELFKALGGEVAGEDEPGLVEEVNKSLDPDENPDLAGTLDVTGYLAQLHKGFQDSVAFLADSLEKSETAQNEKFLVLCKGLSDVGKIALYQGKVIKSLQGKIDTLGGQPARAPKARLGPGDALNKSFAGSGDGGEDISKADIQNTLDAMHEASLQKGNKGFSACGEDINMAITKFENGSQISPALWQEMMQFRALQTH